MSSSHEVLCPFVASSVAFCVCGFTLYKFVLVSADELVGGLGRRSAVCLPPTSNSTNLPSGIWSAYSTVADELRRIPRSWARTTSPKSTGFAVRDIVRVPTLVYFWLVNNDPDIWCHIPKSWDQQISKYHILEGLFSIVSKPIFEKWYTSNPFF